MKSDRFKKEGYRPSQKRTSLPLQLFTMLYALFFIAAQLVSPTTAYFSDTKTIAGTIAAAVATESFGTDKQLDRGHNDKKIDIKPIRIGKEKDQEIDITIDNEKQDVNHDKAIDDHQGDTQDSEDNIDQNKVTDIVEDTEPHHNPAIFVSPAKMDNKNIAGEAGSDREESAPSD